MTNRIAETFAQALEEKAFPAAAVLVASQGEVLYRNFFGPVAEQTLFDIASLTKPIVPTTLLLLAKQEGIVNLDTHLIDFLPEIEEDKYKISLRHLLKHTSGLPAWRPFFQDIEKDQPELVGKRESRSLYLQKISRETLELPIAYQKIYSDLGFILLGILLEDFFHKPLDQLLQEKITGPLEMSQTGYQTSPPTDPTRFAPTEFSSWRKRLLQGEVHDDNAYTLGGVAGHAGLFSTVDDIHRFCREIVFGYQGKSTLFTQEPLLEFIGPRVRFKLGWDTPAFQNSQAGQYFTKNGIGHLGYSGCSFWINPEDQYWIILLTNRVHPSAENELIKTWRPKLYDVLYEEIIRR